MPWTSLKVLNPNQYPARKDPPKHTTEKAFRRQSQYIQSSIVNLVFLLVILWATASLYFFLCWLSFRVVDGCGLLCFYKYKKCIYGFCSFILNSLDSGNSQWSLIIPNSICSIYTLYFEHYFVVNISTTPAF